MAKREKHVFSSTGECIAAFFEQKVDWGRSSNTEFHDDVLFSYGTHFPLAVRTYEGDYILNGDTYSITTSKHQTYTRWEADKTKKKVCIIPFSALYLAIGAHFSGTARVKEIIILDIQEDSIREVERTNSKGEKYMVEEHLLGGCLIKREGRAFLSGIDSTGNGWRGLYFLTELTNSRVKTVEQGYEAMKPKEVREAEAAGLPVARQGEWFFIKVDTLPECSTGRIVKDYVLPNKDNRTGRHKVTRAALCGKRTFAQGVVRHMNNEHKALKLYEAGTPVKEREWFEVFENVQRGSWSAINGGRVD